MLLLPKVRVRSEYKSTPRGTAYFANTGVPISGNNGSFTTESEVVTDFVRPKSDMNCYNFEVQRFKIEGGELNGVNSNSATFSNFQPEVYMVSANFPHMWVPDSPSNTVMATQVAARTNPSRPVADVPVDIFELGDVASLLKRGGKTVIRSVKHLIREGANANLAYQFGLAPLIDDLVNVLKFEQKFAKRMQEIQKLTKKGGLRRTVKKKMWSTFDNSYKRIAQSQGINFSLWYWGFTHEAVWGHARWVPQPAFGKLSASQIDWMVRRAYHGLTVDLSMIWQSLPWTWLIDYSTNIGDYFKAKRNIIPATLMSVHVMRHTVTVYEHPAYPWPNTSLKMSRVFVTRESKLRTKIAVAPVAHFPFLTGNQVGILSSLWIQRNRRWFR